MLYYCVFSLSLVAARKIEDPEIPYWIISMDSEEGLDDLPSPDSTKGGKKKVKQDKPKKGNWVMTRATKLPLFFFTSEHNYSLIYFI